MKIMNILNKMEVENILTSRQVVAIAEKYCKGEIKGPVLRARNNKVVTRISISETKTVILKLWSRPGLKATLREITNTSSLFREVYTLEHLKNADVRVPTILGFTRFKLKNIHYTHALILEDINPSVTAMVYMDNLMRKKLFHKADEFVDTLIRLTHQIIKAEIIDPDHNMINILVNESGVLFRIDLELARHVPNIESWGKGYGAMIGHIVSSFIFAVQPDMDRAKIFSDGLISELNPPEHVLRRARKYIHKTLTIQKERKSIDTNYSLTW